jgi:excisionase family DNA binding protein
MKDEVQRTMTADEMPEKWVNLEDIADYLSVSNDTIRNWIKGGKLPYYKAGKRYKFKISEVDEWLRKGKITE